MSHQIHNWAGNVEFRPARVHRPTSLAELQRTVAAADRVRAFGTGHSFNRIAATDGDLVLLDSLPAQVDVDTDAGTAVISAGMRLADIAPRLHAAGFALPGLPSLPHISLAGACATGTHGSGNGTPGLAALVRAIHVVGPDGDVTEISREGSPDFAGAVVSLGALGVVTQLIVELQPAFDVAQRVWSDVPLDRVLERYEDVFSAGYSVSVFTDWNRAAAIWVKERLAGHGSPLPASPGSASSGPASLGLGLPEAGESVVPPHDWLDGRLADQPSHPIPGMPAENCTEQLGVPGPWHERLPHFRSGFTPSSGEELQSEFFIARPRVAEALAAVRALGEHITPVLQISEIRTIAGDDLWLSPCHDRDSGAIHFTWIADRAAVTPVLTAVERELLPLGARPHWGKLFLSGPEAALATYQKAAVFERLMRRHDPKGKFRNGFVQDLFPASD
ncbi:MAG: FAD-binding protein [Catenulispora sp.]|nr:FAD-binding protein [Catenulispora sp.]